MANIGTSWTTVKTKTVTLGSAKVKFLIQAKYEDVNTSIYPPQTLGFQTRLRSEVSGATPYGDGYEFTCTYCSKRSGSGKWTFETENIITSPQKTITHESDGSKSLTLSARVKNTAWGLDVSFSGTATLMTLDTLASIETFKVNNVDVTSFSDESSPVITYRNPNNYDVRPYIKFINAVTPDYEMVFSQAPPGTYTFDLTYLEYSQLNDKVDYLVEVGLISEDNGTEIGRSSFPNVTTMEIINARPTGTITVAEQNSKVTNILGANSQYIINNASRLKLTATATPLKDATISNIRFYYGLTRGDNYQDITTAPYEYTYDVKNVDIISVGSTSYMLENYITDSRGYHNQHLINIVKTIIDYKSVENTSLSVKRINPTSTFYLNGEFRYYDISFNGTPNVPTIKWQVEGEGGTWHTISSLDYTIDSLQQKITISNYVIDTSLSGAYELDYTKDGKINIKISDLLTEDVDSYEVTPSIPTFDCGKNDMNINGQLFISDITPYNQQGDRYQVEYTPFRVGDTYTVPSRLCIGGLLTSSKSNIFATIFLPRPIQAGVKPTITDGNFILRGMGRYIEGTDSIPIDASNLSNMQIVANTYGDNQIEIQIHKGPDLSTNVAFTSQDTMGNNTPVAVMVTGLEITFVSPS